MSVTIEAIARTTHEANKALCEAFGDNSQVSWDDAPKWQRDSAIAGVEAARDGRATTPREQHDLWVAHKRADGWVYGAVKDATAKTHPCMIDYDSLPPEQRAKDHVFRAIVGALL